MTAVIEPDKKKHNFTFWRFHSISCCRPPPIIQYTGAVNKTRFSWHYLDNSGGDEFTWPHLIITSWCAVKEPLYLRGSALVIREAVIQLSLPLPLSLCFYFRLNQGVWLGQPKIRKDCWIKPFFLCINLAAFQMWDSLKSHFHDWEWADDSLCVSLTSFSPSPGL